MSIISRIRSKHFRYLLSGSRVTVEAGGELIVGRGVSIEKSVIYIAQGSKLVIGDKSKLVGCVIYTNGRDSTIVIGKNNTINGVIFDIYKSECTIGDYNIISRTNDGYPPRLVVCGKLTIGNYNKLCCILWIRFGGQLIIGDRNAINQRTEIRADKQVTIGSYNQISYDCVIWDTNTHNIYTAERRREITDKQYPDFGLEFEPPETKPVHIGDDCWISRGVSILKGVTIADKTIIAYNTTIVKGEYRANSILMNKVTVSVKENNL